MKTSLFILVLSVFAQAAEYVPLAQRARAHSLTGAAGFAETLYTNPAASLMAPIYAVGAEFRNMDDLGISIVDSKTSALSGAIGYFRSPAEIAGAPDQGLKLALSLLAARNVGLGVAGKMIWGARSGQNISHKDLDMGLYSAFGAFEFGLTTRNMLGGNAGLGLNREWSLGTQFTYNEIFAMSLSTVSEFQRAAPYEYAFGVEYRSGYKFSLKGGYRFQPGRDFSAWSAGVSIDGPKLQLQYALEIPEQPSSVMTHTFGIVALL